MTRRETKRWKQTRREDERWRWLFFFEMVQRATQATSFEGLIAT